MHFVVLETFLFLLINFAHPTGMTFPKIESIPLQVSLFILTQLCDVEGIY